MAKKIRIGDIVMVSLPLDSKRGYIYGGEIGVVCSDAKHDPEYKATFYDVKLMNGKLHNVHQIFKRSELERIDGIYDHLLTQCCIFIQKENDIMAISRFKRIGKKRLIYLSFYGKIDLDHIPEGFFLR